MCGLLFWSKNEKINDKDVKELFQKELNKLNHRGPDNQTILDYSAFLMGFNRLSIMDLSNDGNQPFKLDNNVTLMCNGEIYNYKELKSKTEFDYQSDSDCEVLLPLFLKNRSIREVSESLDGEYAIVFYDHQKNKVLASRDPIGIRPLFIGENNEGKVCFSSEAKALLTYCKPESVKLFPPGHYYEDGNIIPYKELYERQDYHNLSTQEVYDGINKTLTEGVKKRLNADAKVGYLLSGGLDSSLVCAIAQKFSDKPIKTFAVGIDKNPIDTKYAKIVADYIGSDHTEVLFTEKDILDSLKDVIWHLESWDITTIRASIGMFLVCKHIHENTDIKVLLTGEVSDEIFGYKYTDFAPSEEEFQKEAEKRLKELHFYDVLRADRCIASQSLEARVPFSDQDFVRFVMNINPKHKVNTTGIGKYLLRKSFEKDKLLPDEILFREKAAFSDAVGHRSVDYLKELAEKKYSDKEFEDKVSKYKTNKPITKEALMYREIFDSFFLEFEHIIPSIWMPNKEWDNCNVNDPSARALPNYGKSGE